MTQLLSKYAMSVKVTHFNETLPNDIIPCVIGKDIIFDANALQTYASGKWEPLIYDCMLVTAAIEICDLTRPRSTMNWERNFSVSIPVHNPQLWNSKLVQAPLLRALKLLTGDSWAIRFYKTPKVENGPIQSDLGFPYETDYIVPFSDGLDSRAVTGVISHDTSKRITRVRVGSNKIEKPSIGEKSEPFANVPFKVRRLKSGNGESSGRSRGFKFAMLSGLAAYLIGAKTIIVPESGQGALGPVLASVGQSFLDRRTHPQFTNAISQLLEAIFDNKITFDHPVLWNTKGESLSAYKKLYPDSIIWEGTKSCWKDARHSSLNGEHIQCGVCAACMLRRTSLHVAGYEEPETNYIWQDLSSTTFIEGAHKDHHGNSISDLKYAIAGVLHMDHLAAIARSKDENTLIQRQALVLGRALEIPIDEAARNILNLLDKHADEWSSFVNSFSKNSFIRDWAKAA